MFHFDSNDELCPFYLQSEDGQYKYNTGLGHMAFYNKSTNKKVTATSA